MAKEDILEDPGKGYIYWTKYYTICFAYLNSPYTYYTIYFTCLNGPDPRAPRGHHP